MRTGFAPLQIAFACAIALLFAGSLGSAAQLREAEVTQVVKDVKLLPGQAAPHPAAIRDSVREGTAVRTGDESRTELTFTDQTLARLGANTLFSFNEGARKLDLGGGAMLLSVPKDSASATVRTAAVTAAITGGTALLEHHKKAFAKFICLEGFIRVYLKESGEFVVVLPGQMLMVAPNASHLPEPVYVDLKRIVETCPLLTEFPTWPNYALIEQEVQKQEEKKEDGTLIGSTSPGPNPDPQYLDPIDQAINALGPIGGALNFVEIGPLNTITSPNPYVINSGTQIMTAPTITTNGVINGGKIYRGVAQDGQPMDYLFGSTSSFDQLSGLDEDLKQASNLPIAAFKFTSLQLTGNPTITVPGGGASKLVLVSVGNLTSAAPGGTLTFAGLETVILSTQNGSIALTPDITFSGIPLLVMHARGAGSNITLGSPVNSPNLRLQAEGSVQVNAAETVSGFNAFAGTDFLDGTGHVVASSIIINAGNNINFTTADFATAAATSLSLQAGTTVNLDVRTDQSVFANANVVTIIAGNALNLTPDAGGTTISFANSTPVQLTAGAGGINAAMVTFTEPSNSIEFGSQGDIAAASIVGGDSISAAGNIATTGNLIANFVSASGSIASGGDLTGFNSVAAGTTINVTNTLLSPQVGAGGNITADHVEAQNINPGVVSSATTLMAGAGGITPFIGPSGSGLQHTFNVMTIQSPAGINFSGINFGAANNGGLLTINAQSQTIGGTGIASANFNGADGDPAGGGGTFTLNTVGDLTVGANIDATTGIIPTNGTPSGAGGTVNLTSTSGAVTVGNSRIRVSSADLMGTVNRRSSATGGRINISTGGTAIVIQNTAQLLALLETASPGNNGLITIAASAGNSGIQVLGQVQADHGEIDIRDTGTIGTVLVSGANANLHADVIKVASLGSGGTLTIGTGSVISADSVLKLYANSSNGQIIFNGNCSIGGGSLNVIAANTVTISGAATVVTVNGAMADVYTNVPNYTGSGGNNMAGTGTFGGSGATTHLGGVAPPLGGPGQGP